MENKNLGLRMRKLLIVAEERWSGKNATTIKTELAKRVFPNKNLNTQRIDLVNLISGRTKRFTEEQISAICQYFGCSADYLFGLSETIFK